DDEEEQESRLSEEARIQKEEDAEELYHDVNINQGRGLQVTQNVEDTHVILTPDCTSVHRSANEEGSPRGCSDTDRPAPRLTTTRE
nr:hypothetical protein [Tanacetum cinerariifolium]